MASIDSSDRDNMISAVIHLANKDYASLVDDFVALKILPEDSNRQTIIPLMDKALSPYVKGGGAKKYEEELRKLYGMEERENMQAQVGGFQAMTQDALTVLNDIPFSIPPYFAILGRAIVTLEGVALTGNPGKFMCLLVLLCFSGEHGWLFSGISMFSCLMLRWPLEQYSADYGIIMESYPFIARKLLREGRPEIQKALQEVLYSSGSADESSGLKLTRLLALLNNAAGSVATQDGAAFVDLDSVPENGLSLADSLRFVLSDQAESLRTLLEPEVDNIVDILSRQVLRRTLEEAVLALTPPRPPSLPFLGDILPPSPKLDEVPFPFVLPRIDSSTGDLRQATPSLALMSLRELSNVVAPKLTQDEEIFAIGLAEGAEEFLGPDIAGLFKGERVLRPQTVQIIVDALRSGTLARSQFLSSSAAKSVLDFVSTALDQVQQRRGGSATGGAEIYQIIDNLPTTERARLDGILEELTQRAIQRILQRAEKIERIA